MVFIISNLLNVRSYLVKSVGTLLDKVSSEFEEPTVCELEFKLTEVPRLRGTSAFVGEILMAFVGKKSERDLGFPEY